MIVHDPRNPRAIAFRAELERRVVPPDHLVVVIGGDGFLLRTVALLGIDRVYLGLNAGTLGFLLNDVHEWDQCAAQIAEAAYTVHTFPLLEASITVDDGSVVVDRAINDVYLERSSGQTARLSLFVDGHPAVDKLVADGIIASTALGSTAYTFSAGGPAAHPGLRMLTITPICPHHPRLHPFALPPQAHVRISVADGDRRPVRAVADGRTVENVREVELWLGDEVVRLAYFAGHDFTSRMIRKILRP